MHRRTASENLMHLGVHLCVRLEHVCHMHDDMHGTGIAGLFSLAGPKIGIRFSYLHAVQYWH